MAIQRWDPLRELMRLRQRMNLLFDESLSRTTPGEPTPIAAGWRPPMDLHEEPGRYVLRVDLPGVDPADLEVVVHDGTLVLRGERKADPAVPAESYLRVERPHGRFHAELALPPSVDPGAIEAVHRTGVVEVALPKRRRTEGPSQVRVKVE
jgi:HSP20 family protein